MTNDLLLARLSSGDELIHPIRTGSSVEVRTHTYTGCGVYVQTATLETEICGQRLSTARAAMSHGDGRKESADRSLARQAAGMSCYSVAQEIVLGGADYLVELRGFEPLTSADQPPVRGEGAGLILPRARRGSDLDRRCFP